MDPVQFAAWIERQAEREESTLSCVEAPARLEILDSRRLGGFLLWTWSRTHASNVEHQFDRGQTCCVI